MPRLLNCQCRSRTFHRLAACVSFAIPVLLVGCGGPDDQPELGTVTGTITSNGKPLDDAWVEFVPEKGRLSAGRTDAEGKYTLQYTFDSPGAKVGTHTVKIGTGGGEAASHSAEQRMNPTGGRKQLFEKTGVTVDSGENTLDFEITEDNEYQGPAGRRPRGGHGSRR